MGKMSDKYCALYVIFKDEISEEDLKVLKKMILSLKGVVSVKEEIADGAHRIAREQVKYEFRQMLLDAFK